MTASPRRTWLFVALALVVVGGATIGILVSLYGGRSERERSAGPGGEKQQMLHYEVLTTVEYEGQGTFRAQSSGVLSVGKKTGGRGQTRYAYSLSTNVTGGKDQAHGEFNLPPVLLLRDAKNDRLTGGDRVLRNAGIVANRALDEIRTAVAADGRPHRLVLNMGFASGFPRQLTYEVTVHPQRLKELGNAVTVLAISEPFGYVPPDGGGRVGARHRVLYVLDESREQVYYRCSAFDAQGSARDSLRIEDLACQLKGGKPVLLAGLDENFTVAFRKLRLHEKGNAKATTTGLPLWAMHSLAVRDAVDLAAGAAVEGRPNFAICATVGMVMLADSAVSATTSLLHEAGVIDWEWKGIPGYLGRGVGLGAAKVYEKTRGRDVDEEKWKDIGEIGGDIASLFIPAKAMGTGVKLTVKGGHVGLKAVKGVSLAGKSLRVSKHGLDIVKAGKGWLASAKAWEKLQTTQKILKSVGIAKEASELTEDSGKRRRTRATDGIDGTWNVTERSGKALGQMIFRPDGTVTMIDGTSGKWNLTKSRRPDAHILDLAYAGSKDRCFLYFVSDDRMVFVQGEARLALLRKNAAFILKPRLALEGHTASITSLSFSPDGTRLVAGGNDGKVIIWDVNDGKKLKTAVLPSAARVTYSADGKQLLAYCSEGVFRGDASSAKLSKAGGFKVGYVEYQPVAFSPDGTYLVVAAGGEGNAVVRDTRTLRASKQLGIRDTRVLTLAVAVSPDSKLVLAGRGDAVVLWDVKTGKSIRSFAHRPLSYITCIAFSPDKKWFLAAGAPGGNGVFVWNLSSNAYPESILGKGLGVGKAVFSPDSRFVLAVGFETYLYHVRSGVPVARFKKENPRFGACAGAFSPNGRFVALGGSDGKVRLFRLAPGL